MLKGEKKRPTFKASKLDKEAGKQADGQAFVGRLPAELEGHHFGPTLVSYILYQHHHCQITQPLLREQLGEWGIAISAGQFNVMLHGLCWVHSERLVHRLIPLNDAHREDIAQVRGQIWSLYADRKDYKDQPRAAAFAPGY